MGNGFLNEYLGGKQFILYTDHRPLEKLGHLHNKTLNRLQSAPLEHDFIIQYKKGSNMPVDYLSRLLAIEKTEETTTSRNLSHSKWIFTNFK
jgi:hypothetical protein